MKKHKAQSTKRPKTLKMFIVKKYIMAHSAHEALKKERKVRPDDVWVDEDFRKENKFELQSSIGFETFPDYEFNSEWAKKPK